MEEDYKKERKKRMKKAKYLQTNFKKSQGGITLIALIVTIIILLILAGVVISMIIGYDFINKAKDAVEEHRIHAAKERLELKLAELQSDVLEKGEKYKLELEDLIVINGQEKNMLVETMTEDEDGNEIPEKVKIYSPDEDVQESKQMNYTKVTVDGYDFKVYEDLTVEYMGKNGETEKDEKDKDYVDEEGDENETDEIVKDSDLIKDDVVDKIGLNSVPTGWIGIWTEQDLIDMKNDLTAKYILMVDLNLTKTWTPLGAKNVEFTGCFNGNGHQITNLKINGTDGYLGLFAKTGGTCYITNLTLDQCKVQGKGYNIGLIAGYNKANIKNVFANGTITISGVSNYVGGLVGYHRYYSQTTTKIERVYTSGIIDGLDFVNYAGGIAGAMQGYSSNYSSYTGIQNSYTSMEVNGKWNVGGIVGKMYYSSLLNVYTIGSVTASKVKNAGGVVATINHYATAQNAFWARDISKQSTSALGSKKTLTELIAKSTYTGYNFSQIWDIQEGKTTAFLRNMTVPDEVLNILKGYEEMLGSGTAGDPYQIRTIRQLQSVANDLTAYYKLMVDLDLSSESNWTPIGTNETPFTGNFNGNGHTISNMKINSTTAYKGLFGYAGEYSRIYDLNLENYSITGSGNYVGGLVGYSRAKIYRISTSGTITLNGSSSYIGGVAGYMKYDSQNNISIEQCYTEGNISGGTSYGTYVGGLIGVVDGSASNGYSIHVWCSYSAMNVKVKGENVGGLIGRIQGFNVSIADCYAMGKVESSSTSNVGGLVGTANSNTTCYSSYWIKETTGQSTSALGINKTISTLVKKSSYNWYISNSWENVWDIDEGKSLAYLRGMKVPSSVYDVVKDYPIMKGEGTVSSPYIITNVEQLKKVNADLSAYYQLGNDIDLSSESNWVPIGTEKEPFMGNFNGAGFTISNMKINSSTAYNGLFGYAGENSRIYNLNLENYSIKGSGNYVGGLVGYSRARIYRISASGTITLNGSSSYIGGLVGYVKYNSTNNIVAVAQCYTEGNISGGTSYGTYVGGLIGEVYGSSGGYLTYVSSSYSAMNVKVNGGHVGGLIGIIEQSNVTIRDCYAIGKVETSSTSRIGGLVGSANSNTSCYCSYWIKETTGQNTSALGTHKTISALVKKTSYNWNISNSWENIWDIDEGKSLAYLRGMKVPSIVYDVVKDYPIMEGEGTSSNPYIITNTEQLKKVNADLSAYYKLGNDIDLSSESNWVPIGTEKEPFIGNFNGAGFTISNMKINSSTAYNGLFGHIKGATIQNLNIQNYTIRSSENYVGGLVGYMEGGNIIKIGAKGNITMSSAMYAGGLVGYQKRLSDGDSKIERCWTEGTITRSDSSGTYGVNYGGLIGYATGYSSSKVSTISNCYSAVNVKGRSSIGGLIGNVYTSYVSISYCYARGKLEASSSSGRAGLFYSSSSPSCSSSYWDTETSGVTTSKFGTGKTTEQMKTQSTYSGWNFTSIWEMGENGYPKLK